jgi:hypothetical protein
MAKYKVRDQFFVHLNEQVYEPGTVVELTEEEAAKVAHQVEPVAAVKPAKARGASDAV